FWHPQVKKLIPQRADDSSFGQFGQITKLSDLPKKADFVRLVSAAAELIDQKVKSTSRPKQKVKKPLVIPRELVSALSKNKKAQAAFQKFSPSHQREYADWIAEAKRDETRQKRLATTLKWLTEGKPRHWKYQK